MRHFWKWDIFENETFLKIFSNMRYFISDTSLFYQKKTFRLNTRRFWEIVEKWEEKKIESLEARRLRLRLKITIVLREHIECVSRATKRHNNY